MEHISMNRISAQPLPPLLCSHDSPSKSAPPSLHSFCLYKIRKILNFRMNFLRMFKSILRNITRLASIPTFISLLITVRSFFWSDSHRNLISKKSINLGMKIKILKFLMKFMISRMKNLPTTYRSPTS